MFNTKAKALFTLFYLFQKISYIIFGIIYTVLITLQSSGIIHIIPNYLFKEGQDVFNTFVNLFFWGSIIVSNLVLMSIIKNSIKFISIKLYVRECYSIINNTKITKKAPKVVYVYTVHNDLIEARILENMKQTYKNFEVWISDGSSKKEYQKYVRKFAQKHNINLMQMPLPGSKHKADNLNYFLENYKGQFDYLLIGDCDEAINHNFVEHAVKIYLANKNNKIGFISSLSYCYRSKGLFTNALRFVEGIYIFDFFMGRSFQRNHTSSLTSQVCLLSKELLNANGGKFNDVPLEDWFLETSSVENNFFGILLPTAICYHEFDTSIIAYNKRNCRVYSWMIYWWKHYLWNKLLKFNFKYTAWYMFFFIYILLLPIVIVVLFAISALLYFVFTYWSIALSGNIMLYIMLGMIGLLVIVNLIYPLAILSIVQDNLLDAFLFIPFIIVWFFPMIGSLMKTWIQSMLLGRYMSFGGSGATRTNKKPNKYPLKSSWLWLIVIMLSIICFNSCSFLLLNQKQFLPLNIVFNVYFGFMFLCTFNYILLYHLNFIPLNKNFNRNQAIKFNNAKHNFQKWLKI